MFRQTLGRLCISAVVVAFPALAQAQVIGTFSWQSQPFCNVVTVQVIQQGALYQLAGTTTCAGRARRQ